MLFTGRLQHIESDTGYDTRRQRSALFSLSQRAAGLVLASSDSCDNAIVRCPVLDAGATAGTDESALGKSFSGGAGDARASAWSRIAL